MDEELRIIISGGGTGGHIFPAVSIANAIKTKHPEAKILFVGADGRMEMQRVPAAASLKNSSHRLLWVLVVMPVVQHSTNVPRWTSHVLSKNRTHTLG